MKIYAKHIIVIYTYIIFSIPAHAVHTSWCKAMWEHVLERIPVDPCQFEQLGNEELVETYCYYGARILWGGRWDRDLLRVAGNQLRFNHKIWPLTPGQLLALAAYQQFEVKR